MSDLKDQETLVFRKATVADKRLLTQICWDSFSDTYADRNTPENMAHYLTTHFTEPLLQEELTDAYTHFFIVLRNNDIAGYIKLRFGFPEQGALSGVTLELARFYVMKSFIGKGIGPKMMQFVLDFSKLHNCNNLWLIVWQENKRAIEFYKKWGFEIFAATKFKLGADIQDDWMMKKQLHH